MIDPNLIPIVGVIVVGVGTCIFLKIRIRAEEKAYNLYTKEHDDEARRCQESINKWKKLNDVWK